MLFIQCFLPEVRSYVVYFAGRDADSFFTCKPCTVHMGVLQIVGFVQAVITLLTKILSSFPLLGSHVRDSQFAYRWCHSPMASVDPRSILSQYHNIVISPSRVAKRSNARTLPTQKGAPRLRSSSGEHTATNCQLLYLCVD